MRSTVKYTVEFGGRTMSIYEYAKISGVSQEALRKRARKGQPISQPKDAEIARVNKMRREERRLQKKGGYDNGYTRDEIRELYGYFAGNEEELQILMDFTGMDSIHAETLLEELKYDRRKMFA